MNLRTAKIAAVAAIVLASLGSSLTIRHQAETKLRQTEKIRREHTERFTELIAEYQRLTNRLSNTTSAPVPDHSAEMEKLRREADTLRMRTNEIARRPAEDRQSVEEPIQSVPRVHDVRNIRVVCDSDSPEYALQLSKVAAGERNRYIGDAKNLGHALLKYAQEHNGELPPTFAEAEPYKWQGELPLAGTYKERDTMAGVNDFEIVYHGSRNDVTNIPEPAVAMIRQRDSWPTPNGKFGRIYTMMDGRVCVVESDDNFQLWEAAHIIPPPSAAESSR